MRALSIHKFWRFLIRKIAMNSCHLNPLSAAGAIVAKAKPVAQGFVPFTDDGFVGFMQYDPESPIYILQ